VIVILVLLVGAGILYVLLADQTPMAPPKTKSSGLYSGQGLPKPQAPAANAKAFAAVQEVVSPVQQGQNSSVSIQTVPSSVCNISVLYKGKASKDSGLAPKTADAYGNVTWAWTIDSSVPIGTWPITVTCVYHGRSAIVDTSVQVVE
jgi:hypothetical protein